MDPVTDPATDLVAPPPPRRNLPQLLGDARRWFEEALLAAMNAAGGPPVTSTQVQLFAVLDAEGTTVATLARRMGVARQTAHQAVHGLVSAGLLEQIPDPASARQRLIRRTAQGESAHRRAECFLQDLERQLAERIGHEAVNTLRKTLETPWDPPPVP
ncbi:MarR family transcriptional regulator [Streptomyces rimosus subsp. pseudoverticillatus]|uniref:MarR family winged helix-turn-helix transcriptional regulator n=1 Tax=Streptomyces rimosus TaxID=1927 RepID=UPI0006B267F9|nr:MarR family winged helix-turn-helix transcriptional regulator [Streptomyces rimosus]KOT96202.1 MarR family transcriptional regulator [Streptomyces rimosus subsp. pseudoverticillatus]